MSFKRATWHSGLTYKQTCRKCFTEVTYTDEKLDFRPWFADGFVYCPTCKAPLRHNEAYAIDRPENPVVAPAEANVPVNTNTEKANFCPKCGKAFAPQDNFCIACGTKR